MADCDNSRIQKLRLAGGAPLGCIGTYGDGNSQFLYPDALCVAAGTVYVWTTDLTWRYTFGREGSGYGKFRHPRGVAVHGNELFMADSGNHRIRRPQHSPNACQCRWSLPVAFVSQVFSPGEDGQMHFRRAFGGEGNAPGRFEQPTGVVVARGLLVVSERAGERLKC